MEQQSKPNVVDDAFVPDLNEPMTEADVLLALVMEAVEKKQPIDVIQFVTDLGFGGLVDLARFTVLGAAVDPDSLDEDEEDVDPALEDPDADDLDEDDDGTAALIDGLDDEEEDAAS